MASSPVNFLFLLLLVCIAGWVVFMFAASLLAWLLSRTLGATVGFRVAGWNCVRDATIKFKKGAVESISVGEFKLSLRKSLVKLSFGFISRDPKLQLLISDLEVILRRSLEKSKTPIIQKSRSYGKGKWMVVANMARFLSVSVTDLVVKMPKAILEGKDLSLDLFKNGGSNPVLNVKLHLFPFLLRLGDLRPDPDQPGCSLETQTFPINAEKDGAPFLCEELLVSCEFCHEREVGIGIKHVDVTCGDVIINVNDDMYLKNTSESSISKISGTDDGSGTDSLTRTPKDKFPVLSIKKHPIFFPEKVNFKLPKLDLIFMSQGHDVFVKNNVMGINLRSSKSISIDDSGESALHFDIQLEFSEIHLFKEDCNSVLEIMKCAIVTSIDIPFQLAMPIRAEIDVRLGGTQFNIILSRLLPCLRLKQSRKKKVPSQVGSSHLEVPEVARPNSILWTFTISAPEMTAVIYSMKGLPRYHACSQSSHLFANNIASKGMQLHAEFGEFDIYVADENNECFKESLFGIETNSGSLLHLARVSLDWGVDEALIVEGNTSKLNSSFLVDVTGMGVYFSFQHVESLVNSISSFCTQLQSVASKKQSLSNKTGRSSKKTLTGKQIFKLNIEQCSVVFSGDVGVDNAVVLDPKHVNYGFKRGVVVFSISADGTPRQACITSSVSDGSRFLKYSFSLDISHLRLGIYDDKQSVRLELERSRLFYSERSQEAVPSAKLTLLDIQNAKFVRRLSAQSDLPVCSLFSATDISIRWEPDVHLSLYELTLRLKLLLHNQNFRGSNNVLETFKRKDSGTMNDDISGIWPGSKQQRKKESVFAIDVEILRVSAELADGVETKIHIQSIFSENAKIGILLEGLNISFNDCRVFKSTRIQVSRLPVFSDNLLDVKSRLITRWDWVIQGLDVHICMPYRLHLRAIEDAIEDTFRALKLIIKNKTDLFYPVQKDSSKKVKSSLSKFGSIKLSVRSLTADIEEEPIQGWLDEHYRLIKNEVCELNARLKFLDCATSNQVKSPGDEHNELGSENKVRHGCADIDVCDMPAVDCLHEEIHKKAFLSYYTACRKLVNAESSGACIAGFQSGFRPSRNRASLLALHATELEVTLTAIGGGDSGMIDFIKKVDTIAVDNDIPFARLYGRDMVMHTASLVVQLRNYTYPLFSGTAGKCEGRIVLAQQATCFQPQIEQDVYIGRWRKVRMLRSASGTTPAMKMYSDLPIFFQKGEVSFGVGFEPAFADVSYAFTVALRRANLSIKSRVPNLMNTDVPRFLQNATPVLSGNQVAKKERSLPWWDDMRYYIHGKIRLQFSETIWNVLATTDPYESLDKLQIASAYMDIQQMDGRLSFFAEDFKMYTSSLESLVNKCSLNVPAGASVPFIESPYFSLKVSMDWQCESGNSLNHYLHALPDEDESRKKVYDPFRSTSLSLRWNFELKPYMPLFDKPDASCSTANGLFHGSPYLNAPKYGSMSVDSPRMNLGAYDLVWILRFWSLNYNPPHKLRSFSRWPRFGIPRLPRSGNLSLDKVMTEFFLRIDSAPACVKHMTLGDDDPAKSLIFTMTMLKYELCYSRGKQWYTFDCKREPLDLVYQGLDLHLLKAHLNRELSKKHLDGHSLKKSQPLGVQRRVNIEKSKPVNESEMNLKEGFLLSSDYFTIRKQAPKADPARILPWQDTGRKKLEMTYVRSEFENGSESDQTRSDPSDDDGYNVVIADNCRRVYVYGLKLLWTIENRDAVWSWVGGISKAFEPTKPSPSRQYAQRKLIEGHNIIDLSQNLQDSLTPHPLLVHDLSSQSAEIQGSHYSGPPSNKMEGVESLTAKDELNDDEEGSLHFMVNVIQPQFNLHSEEANGRFLLAAASGRVLARSFHSIVHVGYEMIANTLGSSGMKVSEYEPEMTWKRAEYSVMLEHVQSHVAPTDVDPGAGLQWLPKIPRSSPKIKRTGALLERVFMPCQMYFRYTRYKGASADLKVKPLKELTFNSPNITASMTSRQFQVMLDVLSNLLFARLPKPQKSSLSYPVDDDEDAEEADEVVPDGVEEVELAKIKLEQRERERKLILGDIGTILASGGCLDASLSPEKEGDLWMLNCGKAILVHSLKKELNIIQQSRKAASVALRKALQKAAQLRLMEKEKNKSPSCAMRISMQINKVGWSMLADGKAFADAEINNMVYDFDRDYKDIGIAKFTTQSFKVRNCLPNAKSDMLLAPWNAPPEWGKYVMLRVDANQGAPKDGTSPLELFQVEIYPLRIHLTETMYRMMWDYFFPEEEQDSQRRQEVWKVSTTAGSRRSRKNVITVDALPSNLTSKEFEGSSSTAGVSIFSHPDTVSVSNSRSHKGNTSDIAPVIRRTSSFDRTWEENISEAVANETMLQVHSLSSKSGPLNSAPENSCTTSEDNQKMRQNTKLIKVGRSSHDEKKGGKSQDDKRARTRKMMEFRNIKISQVELLVTYEGSRFAVNDLRLLMDTFHRDDFTGTWRRLFSRVKKHIIWGVLKSVTGMQGKKFKDKAQSQREASMPAVPDIDLNFSDSDGGQPGKNDQYPISWLKRPNDGAGDGFVTSIRGLFNSQRRRAKEFLRGMRGDANNDFSGDGSESDVENSTPFARQLTITKATKKLIRRHTKKFRSRGKKASVSSGMASIQRGSLPSSTRETPYQSDYSGASSYEDFHE